MSHANDPKLLNRLRRAHGHLATIISMVETGREGLEIAQQMQAVISAIEAAKKVLIIDHIEHHLETATGQLTESGREELARIANLAKYL